MVYQPNQSGSIDILDTSESRPVQLSLCVCIGKVTIHPMCNLVTHTLFYHTIFLQDEIQTKIGLSGPHKVLM